MIWINEDYLVAYAIVVVEFFIGFKLPKLLKKDYIFYILLDYSYTLMKTLAIYL